MTFHRIICFGSTLTDQIGDRFLRSLLQLLQIFLDVSLQIPIGLSGCQVVDVLKRIAQLVTWSCLLFCFWMEKLNSVSQPLTISSTTFLSLSASSWSWMWSSTAIWSKRNCYSGMPCLSIANRLAIDSHDERCSPDSGRAFGSFCSFSCSSVGA